MKICWDNIEKLRLTSKGNFIDIKNKKKVYISKDFCACCNEPYLTQKNNQSIYCSHPCSRLGKTIPTNVRKKISDTLKGRFVGIKNPNYGRRHSSETRALFAEYRKGPNNSAWKGGVTKKNLPLYSTYKSKLWADDIRKVINEDGLILIEVVCTKCNEWFVPKRSQVKNRIKFLNGKSSCEGRFYCSDKCRNSCSLSFLSLGQIENRAKKSASNQIHRYEIETWAKEVLKRADYTCEYCGEPAEHAHHIQPKKLEPFLALDPDNGIACCKECHYKYGHKDGCSTGVLLKIICS